LARFFFPLRGFAPRVSFLNAFAAFARGLAISPYYRMNRDIGHFMASGFDPVAYIPRQP
jgi:hypothetical protein